MKQGTEKKAVAERARAARRAAQLRREAGERAEADAKLDNGEPLTINDLLAKLGSAFRVPEETDPWQGVKEGWQEEAIDSIHVDEILAFLSEHHPKGEPAPAQSTPKRRGKSDSYTFTAEDIAKLRDEQGLSWRQVAVNLDLGSPSAARSAYTALTGVDYRESNPTVKRAVSTMGAAKLSTRKVYAPEWNDDSDQDEIIERLTGSRITVRRSIKGIEATEEILVGRVSKLTWDGKDGDGPLCATFTDRDTGGTRSVLVSNIVEVR